MDNIKIVIWGFGAMGSGMSKLLLSKKGVDIIGVCDLHPDRVGKSMFDVLNIERGSRSDIIIKSDINDVLSDHCCDVCICATDSFTKKAFPRLQFALEKKVNVISTAEEMSYPKAQNPDLARKLDSIAVKNGVTILGTGINPGMIMDLLVICMTGCMTEVNHIEAKRINSLSPFGPAVMEEQGVGLSVSEFEKGVASGTLSGHVGFAESITMIGDAIGWDVEKIETQMSPIVTDVDRRSTFGFAQSGNVAGVNMTGQGFVSGHPLIQMIHPQQIEPEAVGVTTGDYITIKGTPEIHLSISPEVQGGLGTIAMCVNMIPHVINACPGLKTMIDLPVPRAIMGDMRLLVHNR